jgi:hypothetical protein
MAARRRGYLHQAGGCEEIGHSGNASGEIDTFFLREKALRNEYNVDDRASGQKIAEKNGEADQYGDCIFVGTRPILCQCRSKKYTRGSFGSFVGAGTSTIAPVVALRRRTDPRD